MFHSQSLITRRRTLFALLFVSQALGGGALRAAPRQTVGRQAGFLCPGSTTGSVLVENQYLKLEVEPTSGQFHLYTSNCRGVLSQGGIDVGVTTLRIDPLANNPLSNLVIYGTGSGRMFTLPVAIDASTIYSAFDTQVGFTGSEASSTSGAAIRVEQRLTLLRDTLKIQYTIRNNGRFIHRIGMRVIVDQDMGNTPGGINLIPGLPPIKFQTEFTRDNMPSSYETVDDLQTPTIVGYGKLIGENATVPDKLVFVNSTAVPPYDITSNPFGALPIAETSAYFYGDSDYNPGASRTYVIYFGLGGTPPLKETSDYEPNPVVALQAPGTVALQQTINPGPGGTSGSFQFNPQTFTVEAFVYNSSQVALADTTAQLILPTGLQLQQGETTSKNTGPIPGFDERIVTWNVSITGRASGELPMVLTTTSPGASSKSVTQTIDVPPLPQDFSTNGLRMIAFPYTFDDPDPRSVLVDQTTGGTLNPIKLATYDPDLVDYRYFDTSKNRIEFTKLEAGKAYWIQTNRDTPLSLSGVHLIPTSQDFLVSLRRDWNMLGSPFLSSIFLGRTRFFYQSDSYTWLDAVMRGLIRASVFGYDPTSGEYVPAGEEFSELSPMAGYWFKAQVDGLTMVFPSDFNVMRSLRSSSSSQTDGGGSAQSTNQFSLPPEYRGTALESYDSRLVRNLRAEWMLRICARTADSRCKDTRNFIGVSSQASDRYDLQDVEKPPPFSGYVNVRFPHLDWGKDAGMFMQDVRRPFTGKASWDMEVATDQANTDIVLTWPNLSQIPKGYRLTLVDRASNKRTYLRAVGSYVFRSADRGGVRQFRIEVDNNPASALRITGVTLSSPTTRSATRSVTFNLSRAAALRCEIKTVAGRSVRVLDPGTRRTEGINFLTWDQRGGAGQILPRGVYLLEIVATTEEQQTVRVVKVLRTG